MLNIYRNPSVSLLYQIAATKGLEFSNSGAFLAFSGEKTGRSPNDKRIVKDQTTKNIWWGKVNKPITPELFNKYREHAEEYYLNSADTLNKKYLIDGFAGWNYKYPVSVYCKEEYHALFMKNMLVNGDGNDFFQKNRESNLVMGNDVEHGINEKPFTIYNLGHVGLSSVILSGVEPDASLKDTLIAIDLTNRVMLIYGTRYAGEMKKGVFSWMMYQMPLENKLCLHSSANRLSVENDDDVKRDNCSLFFGMSGTGKTTLSSDPERILIGDDEHVWHDDGVFNIEGGCYAKCIDLSEEQEPDIYRAIRYGSVLENVIVDAKDNTPLYEDDSITKNTRCSYPLSFIPNSAIEGKYAGKGGHPDQIVFLACDAWGLLPPISKLEMKDALDFFLCGYTSKMAGTEMGVNEPTPTFSACFGEPFLVWNPNKYADMLRERLEKHNTPVWLVNTGWSKYVEGGSGSDSGSDSGEGKRISLKYTRKMIDFIHAENVMEDKLLSFCDYSKTCDNMFNFQIPVHPLLADIPQNILYPHKNWNDVEQYQKDLKGLHTLFHENLQEKLNDSSDEEIYSAL
tara:strand:+ start:113 stop:1816 length:1704 start_codon:yes stop_codon:yes gene_type:complete